MSEAILRTVELKRFYKKGFGKVSAVVDVTLSVAEGETVMVVGPSGAGKSTFLEAVSGLLRPSSGKVLYRGTDIYGFSSRRLSRFRRRKIGFVFQFYHLLPELTVLENVMLPSLMAGCNWISARKKAKKLLSDVGLEERFKHWPSEVSGGEAQRVAIARALVNSPEIIFCDEPTGNLDTASGKKVWGLIEYFSTKRNMTVIAVSHNVCEREMFDTVYSMVDGAITRQ